MKKHVKYLISGLSILSLASCKKDERSLDTQVSAVQSFFAPNNNSLVDLGATTSVLFQWDQSRAADGGLVLYSVAFDKPGGDFSHPVYAVASDGNGLDNKATITKQTLNTIAQNLGVQPLDTVTLIWTVFSSKGINAVMADSSRKITVKRALGIDNPPTQLFITGSATEGGTDISKAIPLKSLGNGSFEIYTSLKPGTYHFVDDIKSSAPNEFYLSNDTIREGEGETTVSGNGTTVDRIDLNFSVVNAQSTQIKEVGLWMSASNAVIFTFDYDHDGIWRVKNKLVQFVQQSYGLDERYKFRLQVNNGTADSYEWWGSVNQDNPSEPTSASPASFYYLFPCTDNQFDYSFKYQGAENGKNCDINVYFSPDIANYTHEVLIDN